MENHESGDLIEEYIITALLKLMEEKPYEDISVTDIAKRAGVVRVTYYRHFNSKADVLLRYFKREVVNFQKQLQFKPRTKEDYYELFFMLFSLFKEHKKMFKSLVAAHVEHIYLDYLNESMKNIYEFNVDNKTEYDAYFYVGALYNISMQWLKNDCADSVKTVADALYNNLNLK